MDCIALTGGIASGKSLFAQQLKALGADVVDADEIVHQLHCAGGVGARAVALEWGDAYLASDGSTDRKRLGALIFSDESARRRLETILHPLVRGALAEWRQASQTAVLRVAQIPLLFETQWQMDWAHSVTLEAPYELRLERLMARGFTRPQAIARIDSQATEAERIRQADCVIRNVSTVAELEHLAQHFFQTYRNH